MMYRCILSILAFIGIFQLDAQSINFVASADAKQIVQGNFVELNFTLSNAEGRGIQFPSFDGWETVSGPSTSTQMTIINGRTTRKTSYQFYLASSTPGKYVVGSATILVDGKKYQTDPIEIEVIKGNPQPATAIAEGSNILRVELNHTTGYVGQQLLMKVVLLTTEDVRSYDFVRFPDMDGFHRQGISRYAQETSKLVIDGVQYTSRVLSYYALYPQKTGTYTIPPIIAELGIAEPGQRTSFFFNTRLRSTRVSSEEVVIKIVDLPAGAPESFCGAVGDFYLGTAVDKKSISSDDAVRLTLQIRGVGDARFIEAPRQSFTEDFDIYEPSLLAQDVISVDNNIQVTKTFEYLLLPKRTGQLTFKPEMTFFNPDSARYQRVISEAYTINVVKGVNRASTDAQSQSIQLPPIYLNMTTSSRPFAIVGTPIYFTVNGLCALAFIGLFVYKRKMDKRDSIDIREVRQVRARSFALSQLANAQKELDTGHVQAYYIELRRTMMQYLTDKLRLDSTQMSKKDISKMMDDYQLSGQTEQLMNLLERGEQALYATISPTNASQDYDHALEIIEAIELNLRD